MYVNKIVISLLLILFTGSLLAQKTKRERLPRRKPSFVLHLGGGMSHYTGNINIQSIGLPGSISRNSFAGTARLMWYPRYRLRLGIETGFSNFYSYNVKNGNINGKVNLQAIPLLVVWSMQVVPRLNIFAGFGSYRLNTHLDYAGKVDSWSWVLGSNLAVSYTLPVSKRMGIAAEAKWMNAFESKDAALSMQFQMVYKLFQWD
ncbi:MAG: hypothetical protein QM791_14000 [Ferruginibacter sp.]